MILRELGDRGSVSAVAAALHLTPSAVSQQLAILQRGAQVPLTRLDGRVLVLTDAGRSLAAAAVDVAAALARAGAAVDAHLTDPTATVRVVAFHSAASAFFPRLLGVGGADSGGANSGSANSGSANSGGANSGSANSGGANSGGANSGGANSGSANIGSANIGSANIECADEDVAQDAFPLLCADYDVVVAHRPAGSGAWPRTVSVTRLLSEPLDVAVPATHPLATKSRLRAADVAGEQWISVHDGFPLTAAIHAIGAAAGCQLTVRHHINDFTVAAGLVAAGAGFALLPRYIGPRRRDVVLRPLTGLHIAREIDVLTRPEQRFRAAVTTVIDHLVSIAASITADPRAHPATIG
ncbi:hypothetical protein Ahu01nite_093470 [Winogradskya humida]|uniref:HTH lysR-type domain-containing protein n=2 Tax=Winogradskya humida TaxID=113566 RepID=A0ABQ4A5V2_9ACTN|nr:hypothetical protein Ahu01nite_093470 [Actinoplanes humidus]